MLICLVLINVEEGVRLFSVYGSWLLEENCGVRVFFVVRRMFMCCWGVNCEEVGVLLKEKRKEKVEEI